jgi:hypothetical protein
MLGERTGDLDLQEQIEQLQRNLEQHRREIKCTNCGIDYSELCEKRELLDPCKITTTREWWNGHIKNRLTDGYGTPVTWSKWKKLQRCIS